MSLEKYTEMYEKTHKVSMERFLVLSNKGSDNTLNNVLIYLLEKGTKED